MLCDPRPYAWLKEGNKNDRIEARKLGELVRDNQLKPAYHGEYSVRSLKETRPRINPIRAVSEEVRVGRMCEIARLGYRYRSGRPLRHKTMFSLGIA